MTDYLINHPNIIIGILVVLVVLTSFKGIWIRINNLILKLLKKTSTTIDETLYILLVSKISQYLQSDVFKDHWKFFLETISDLQLSPQELEQIKFMFATQMSQELTKLGVSIYDEDGKKLVEQVFVEFSEFMKQKYGESWLSNMKIGIICGLFSKWAKGKLQGIVDANRIKSARVVIRKLSQRI